jgi:hypothetical protein
MNRLLKLAAVLSVFLVFTSQISQAQGISPTREYSGFFDSYYYRGPLSFTLGGGMSLYNGNISKSFFGTPGMALALGANYKFWPKILLGGEFGYMTLAGSTGDSINTSFTGSHYGLTAYGRYYLKDDIVRKAGDRMRYLKVKSYISLGASLIRFNASLTPQGLSHRAFTPAFPVGFGLEFKVSQRLQVLTELNHSFTLNPRLDAADFDGKKDGFSAFTIKLQYSPFAPKKKKKLVTAPAEPNQNREEHQEWRKKKDVPKPVEEEPGTNTEETPTEEAPTEEQPNEEEKKEEDGF